MPARPPMEVAMLAAPLPPDEDARLASLYELDVLDTVLEDAYDQVTRLAAQLCGVPISLISLVDRDRQWFKSRHGLAATETPRELALCAHAILGWEVFEVEDADRDVRFADNPLTTGAPHLKFYAGVPLRGPDRQALGTLCVIGSEARQLRPEQREALQALAAQVVAQLELRRATRRLALARQAAEAELARRDSALRAAITLISPVEAQGGSAAASLRAALLALRAALPSPPPPAAPAAVPAPPPELRPPLRALVADDNPLAREVLWALLESLGLEVSLVGDGRAAVEAATLAQQAGAPYALAVLDVHMPLLDGPGAAMALRALLDPAPCLVGLSADPSAEDAARCAAAGCVQLLHKPPSRAALAALVAGLRAPMG
ncbi:MAG: response regulator [Deltaproteobacteria bacterium]|nr:response regulator [Deltaproteobacteria bacterium]